uniref:(California timema) hypothetical protein n=1 Tax=Timema californicum TaxID=61474 RepID=A0A7R9J7E2_TIMCA|nr:unnamed protein product [Timema californicum]
MKPLALSTASLKPIFWDGGWEGERRGMASQLTKVSFRANKNRWIMETVDRASYRTGRVGNHLAENHPQYTRLGLNPDLSVFGSQEDQHEISALDHAAVGEVGVTASDNPAWKINKEYKYSVTGRTLTALHQVSNQYAGILIKASLSLRLKSPNSLIAKISKPQYASIHTKLPGWSAPIPDRETHWNQLPLSEKPWEIKLKDGLIDGMTVSKTVPIWEVNILKGIASQLQVNTQGKHLTSGTWNQKPSQSSGAPNEVYRVMEDTVTGECEVLYDVSPLPAYVLQSQPELAPLWHLGDKEQVIDVVKSQNFSKCDKRLDFQFGIDGISDFKHVGENKAGNFLSRSALSRIVLTGSLNEYVIQSSVTTNKVILSPMFYNEQKGMIFSRLNLTLVSWSSASGSPPSVSDPRKEDDLIYSYESSENNVYQKELEEDSLLEMSLESGRSASEESSGSIRPISSKINPVEAVRKIASEIGSELQYPDAIPKENTLAKFTILTRLVQVMSAKQLKEAGRSLYTPSNKPSSSRTSNTWKAFRDAVGEAGTGPALVTLKEWIMSKKVRGEDAAELVSSLPRAALTPTPEYLNEFFKLATSPEVTKQSILNTSAILSFTNLVRMSQVDNSTSHKYYPTHLFGRFSLKNNSAVQQEYIPWLERALESAVSQADSPKIQLYIRALGNIAHLRILDIFEPYLEGEKNISTLQKVLMVVSMDKFSVLYPKIGRQVMYRIYQNMAQPHELRCAAVFQIMKAQPPANMLQRMAELTNEDPHAQVNAAVKSAIFQIDGMTVSKTVPIWEVNILKGIASQLQVNTQGKHLTSGTWNQKPSQSSGAPNEVYRVMEDTVTGECEVLYDVSPLPAYVLQSQPELAPLWHLGDKEQVIDVVKSQNFSKCDKRLDFQFGIDGISDFKHVGENKAGNFLSRSALSRIVLTGSLNEYVIQSSVTTNKVILSPMFYNEQKGMIFSRLNLTLVSWSSASGSPPSVSDPRKEDDLIYSYESSENNVYQKELEEDSLLEMSLESGRSASEESSGSIRPISSKINPVEAVRKIASEIGSELQYPDAIPKENTLAKFTILTRLVQVMSAKQLKEAGRSLKAFRDAVGEAGTGPALVTLKEWIMSKKVRGEDAAELVSSLPRAALTPTPEYLNEFFKLATSPEVTKQSILNTSAILSFTNLVRMSQVDNSTSHKYYPTHLFGRFSLKNNSAVQQEYIPWLERALESAVSQADSPKIQLYIRALGNIAHLRILDIFEPYLEGEKNISTLQKVLMVVSMDKFSVLYPKIGRQVMYRIYQNMAQPHELRCAAVFQIMKAQPPANMLQRMAELTNEDPHAQVNAAVKSAIESAANLQGPWTLPLALNAKAAVHLLNPEKYGSQYTRSSLRSYASDKLNLGFEQQVDHIGSDDHIVPRALLFNVRRNLGGVNDRYMSFDAMTSSVDDLLDVLLDQIGENEYSDQRRHFYNEENQYSENPDSKWNLNKIGAELNIKTLMAEQLEGNILFQLAASERFFAFDNHTIEALPSIVKAAASALHSGNSFNFTKFYNQEAVTVGFPNVMGLPFLFTFNTPTLLQIGGEARIRTHPDLAQGSANSIPVPSVVNASAEVHFVYSTKIEGQIGFVTPFDHRQYVAAVDKNTQLNLPISASVDVDMENSKIQATFSPINSDRDYQIFHYSSKPYTTKHDIINLKPHNQDSDYHKIHVLKEPRQQQAIFGENSTGMAFRLNYKSEKEFNSTSWIVEEAKKKDPLVLLYFPWADDTIQYTNVSLTYDARRSSTKAVKFTVAFANETSSSRHSEESKRDRINPAEPSSLSPDSETRRQEFLDRVAEDIKSSSAMVVDVSAEFQGHEKAYFIATAAVASSPVDEKARALFFFSHQPASSSVKPLQAYLVAESKNPQVSWMDFNKAIREDPKSSFNAQLNLKEWNETDSQIVVNGTVEQSYQRRRFVKHSPMAKLCESQMNEGNYGLPACRNVSIEANYRDRLEFSVHYENLPTDLKNLTYKAYQIARYLGYNYMGENIFSSHNLREKVVFEGNLNPSLRAINVTIKSPIGDAEFIDVPLNPYVVPLLPVHPTMGSLERLSPVLFSDQLYPYCVVGRSAANTFDNKTYPIQLGKCWHVMMKYAPKYIPGESSENIAPGVDVAVMTRDNSSSSQKDLKIVTGDDVVDLTPSGGSTKMGLEVKVNERPLEISSSNLTEIYNPNGDIWLQIFELASGSISLTYPLHGIYLIYDGKTITLKANHTYRGEVRGLCGTFTGEPVSDFKTPNNCIMKQPELFVASYALTHESCQGPALEYKKKAQEANCTTDDIKPLGGQYSGHSQVSISSESSESSENSAEDQSKSCSVLANKVFDEGNMICISVRPQPACASDCSPSKMQEKNVPVHCLSPGSAANHMIKQIKKGARLNLARKGITKSLRSSLPVQCVRD